MNFSRSLNSLNLNPDNSIVIGSGILSTLGIRDNKDIDVVVDNDSYTRLSKNNRFRKLQIHGREILTDELFEIGTSWDVLGKNRSFDDLMQQSTVINGTRFITIEFLLVVKKSWAQDANIRQKDFEDIKLINTYLANQIS